MILPKPIKVRVVQQLYKIADSDGHKALQMLGF